MTVKELIELLNEYPKNFPVNFYYDGTFMKFKEVDEFNNEVVIDLTIEE